MSMMNKIRKFERFRFFSGFVLVGILFMAFSVIALSQPKRELVSAEGIIDRLESYTDEAGELQWRVFVSYADLTGERHGNVPYPAYDSFMEEGKTVTVLYDPAAPEAVQSSDAKWLPYVLLAAGVLSTGAGVIGLVKSIRRTERCSPFETGESRETPTFDEPIRDGGEPEREYYFHWTGRLNQSYVLETPAREAVYEATCDHIGIFTPYRYTFLDHRTGGSRAHTVTHTVTTRYGNGTETASFSVVSASDFKIDGVNNWAYLHGLGYSVEPKRSGLKLNFDVLRNGVPAAHLEAAGTNLLKDGAKNPLGDKLPAPGVYRVSCKSSELEAVFYACFCVSRTEFC